MRRYVLTTVSLLFLLLFQASAQNKFGSQKLEELATAQFHHQRFELLRGSPSGARKTSSNGQRLIALSSYDYSLAPGKQNQDSLRFKYSGSRSSEFDYLQLKYDTYNVDDYLPNMNTYNSYNINFDVMWRYLPPGSSNANIAAARIYTDAGDVSILEHMADELALYQYNSANQRTHLMLSYYDSTRGFYEYFQYFYYYDAEGKIARVRSEEHDGPNWQPYFDFFFTYNERGLLEHIDNYYNIYGAVTLYYTTDFTYSTSSRYPNSIFYTLLNMHTRTLENSVVDSFEYAGDALTRFDIYSWDSASAAWIPYWKENRRLNSNSRPDSVFILNWAGGSVPDTTIKILAYNAQNNPIWEKLYAGSSAVPDSEMRWYYEDTPELGISAITVRSLEFYPNPARDNLYLRNIGNGIYAFHNSLGQLVQSGRIRNSDPIPVSQLPPGQYFLRVEAETGTYSAQVMKE